MNTPMPRDDRILHERFAALRASDATHAPGFDALLAARSPPRSGWAVPAFALAAAFAVLVAWRRVQMSSATQVASVPMPDVMLHVANEMPSDFLLETGFVDVRREPPALDPSVNQEVPFL